MLAGKAVGVALPDFKTIATYHPQFALAIASGVPVRPSLRTLAFEFDNDSVGTFEPASFDEIISSYSIFTSVGMTIDPTGAFAGNLFKGLNDVTQGMVTGITFTLAVLGRGDDYTPIPEETPLQLVPQILNSAAGMWHMDNPQDVKARCTIAADTQNGLPFTVWMTFNFMVLGEQGHAYTCMKRQEARAELCKMGMNYL